MGSYKEIKGDLIELSKYNNFDVIAQGCNCFSVQGAGIARQMVKAFGTDKFDKERYIYRGDVNKLGQIDYMPYGIKGGESQIIVVNAYTQYNYGRDKINLDYEALTLCMRKINHTFANSRVGLPQIGAGLAGGDWSIVKQIIEQELKDCHVTVVIYEQ